MTLGLPARAQRALEACQQGHWLIHTAEWVPGLRKVRVYYERPSGDFYALNLSFLLATTRKIGSKPSW